MSINDGLALIRQHKFQEALTLLATEVRARPDDGYACYYLAYAFVGAADPQPAVVLLTRLLNVQPDFLDARCLLGLARIRTSDFDGAAQEYDLVLKKNPQNAAALLGLGMIHYWRREYSVAEDYLDRSLRLEPGSRDALVFKADLRYSAGDVPGAVNLLRDARRLRRPSLPELTDLEINDRLVHYEAALEPLRLARGGLPPYPNWVLIVVGVTLAITLLAGTGLLGAWSGMAHYQSGKHRLARLDYPGCAAEMAAAISAVPVSPKAWAYEAYCYLLDHDNQAGLGAWNTARSFEPDITLDTKEEQLSLIARLNRASAQPPVVK
jgi:tetratricopeptide (TPR) repeat protein